MKEILSDWSNMCVFSEDRLDVYIYDYLMKRKLHASAKAFQEEGKISTDPVGKSM